MRKLLIAMTLVMAGCNTDYEARGRADKCEQRLNKIEGND